MHLLRYRRADGVITGIWTANTPALLEANIREEDAGHAYLLTETDLDVSVLMQDYVVQNGEVMLKAAERT